MSRLVETGLFILSVLLAVNVMVINFVIGRYVKEDTKVAYATISSPSASPSAIPRDPCDEKCQKKIVELITEKLSAQTSKPTSSFTTPKEIYIPLGSGSTSSEDWGEIPGAEATIDTTKYPPIKSVTFEAYMSIPTANGYAYAKLFNATDKHDVWFSEVFMETNTVTKKEAKISLDAGNKVYKVFMKSTLKSEAKLYNARIKIVTE